MQESVEIRLEPGTARFLSEGSLISAKLLMTELQRNIKIIEDLLVSYYFRSRGRVFDVRIKENSITALSAENASFEVQYSIGVFNACADIDSSYVENMKISIVSKPDENRLLLTGEYFPEREPDEL